MHARPGNVPASEAARISAGKAMTEHRDWTGKVGHIWAQEWRRTDRSFRELTPRLLATIEAESFHDALDIGCGAGEIACALADGHPASQVTGVDISPELLGVARERGRAFINLAFAHGDAATATVDPAPDCLVSRHGVMFFVDPTATFAHLRKQASPGARLIFSCFRNRADNEWVAATMSALPDPPPPADPLEPGPFAFGDRDRVAEILDEAGWQDVAFAPIDYRMIFGAGADPVADACDYLGRVGPTATPIAALDDAARALTLGRLAAILRGYRSNDVIAMPAAAWIVTARAPDRPE